MIDQDEAHRHKEGSRLQVTGYQSPVTSNLRPLTPHAHSHSIDNSLFTITFAA